MMKFTNAIAKLKKAGFSVDEKNGIAEKGAKVIGIKRNGGGSDEVAVIYFTKKSWGNDCAADHLYFDSIKQALDYAAAC